jgi:hypothetical protein
VKRLRINTGEYAKIIEENFGIFYEPALLLQGIKSPSPLTGIFVLWQLVEIWLNSEALRVLFGHPIVNIK